MSKIRNWAVEKYVAAKVRQAEAEEGQGLAEYGLILALVAIACIIALGVLGDDIAAKLGEVSSALTGA